MFWPFKKKSRDIVIKIPKEKIKDLKIIFECALHSEDAATGAQECLGCNVPTGAEGETVHGHSCIVDLVLGIIKELEDQTPCEVCPRCGSMPPGHSGK